MPKQKYKDVVEDCQKLRKKELEELCYAELNEEEFRIFMLRVYNQFYRDRVSSEVGKCKESISKIFMRAVRKMRKCFLERRRTTMTDYNNDTTSVRNSHNIDKRRINSNSNSNNNNFQGLRGNYNINVMKADTYNMVLAMLALILVIFSIGSAIWAVDKSKAEVEKYRG